MRESEKREKLPEKEIDRLAGLESKLGALLLSADSSSQKPPSTGYNPIEPRFLIEEIKLSEFWYWFRLPKQKRLSVATHSRRIILSNTLTPPGALLVWQRYSPDTFITDILALFDVVRQ